MRLSQEQKGRIVDLMTAASVCAAPSQHTVELSFEPRAAAERRASGERRRSVVWKAAQRAAMFFLAALISVGAWLTIDAEAREAVFSWVRDIYEGAHIYRFTEEPAAGELPAYGLSWLPEGYEETSVFNDGETVVVLYQRKGDPSRWFEFRYFFAQRGRFLGMSTGDTDYKDLEIEGMQASLYSVSEPGAMSSLILINEDAGIVFQIEGVVDGSVLVRAAESIVLTEE